MNLKNKEENKRKCREKGITLIALVITIVILLILAGISINLLLGENGIVSKSREAVIKDENGAVSEAIQLKVGYYVIDSVEDVKKALKDEGIINDSGVVNTGTLLGKNTKTGNGSDSKDIYIVEDNNLYYYDKDGNKNDLGNLWNKEGEQQEEVDTSLFEVDDEGTLWLKDYKDYYTRDKTFNIEKLIIPKVVDGKEVKKIQFSDVYEMVIDQDLDKIIDGFQNIKTVVIPEGITSIGNYAFFGCKSLISVNIPEGITSIGDNAFYGCSSLISINIPASVKSFYFSAFQNCGSLASIKVDEGNSAIDSRDNCNAIIYKNQLRVGCKNTIIPDSVTGISYDAFYGCSGLTSISIPDSVTSIESNAFYGCSGLTSINIPDGVTRINSYTFYGCSSLTSINIPSSVKNIEFGAFSGCSSLTNIIIPVGITRLGNNAFSDCSSLISIDIPEGITSIGWQNFSGCSSLASITIPASVTSITSNAFSGCTGLTSIKVDENNTVYDGRDNCNAIIKKSNNELIIGCKNTTIPNSVTSIDEDAFVDCIGLTSVSIPSSVKNIDKGAFSGCSGLTSIKVDENNAFFDSRDNCNAIIRKSNNELMAGCKNSTIPNSVTSIGYGAFSGCSGLTNINIPASVTSIKGYAFSKCSGLTSINIPESIISIEGYAFSECNGLASIKVDANNTVFDSRNNCNAVIKKDNNELTFGCKNTTIPNSVTSIGEGAFSGCSDLTSITISDSITSIGGGAFSGCTGLTSINIPSSVTNMGEYVFSKWKLDQTINCEVSSQPSDWNYTWASLGKAKINWGVNM